MVRATEQRLKISEIFYSLQGEALNSGLPTIFIRLTGCPLRCVYCDTAYAFSGGQWQGIEQIVDTISAYHTPYVTVTGGEPLAQKACMHLLTALCDKGYKVSLETSGALSIAAVDPRVIKVMDIKTPASGEQDRNLDSNLACITSSDQIKFVICNEADYEWSKSLLQTAQLDKRCEVLFSACHSSDPLGGIQLEAKTLAGWILRDQLPVRFQIQLHKFLWGDVAGV